MIRSSKVSISSIHKKELDMGDRTGSACVIASTKVIAKGIGPRDIWVTDVVAGFDIDYFGGLPASPPPQSKLVNVKLLNEVEPLLSLTGVDVYPVIRYKYKDYYAGVANYPLLDIQVKILPSPVPPPPEPPHLSPNITCSYLHPFMKWNGGEGVGATHMSPNAKIVPAYSLEENDLIFVDPYPGSIGKVISVTRLLPQDVYGLIVLDLTNAESFSVIAEGLIDGVNTSLKDYHKQVVKRLQQLQLSSDEADAIGYFESLEFAVTTFATALSGNLPPSPPGTIHGLAPEDYMIITNSIASGTLYVQRGYYKEARTGFPLPALVP
jgi:hypothetical protein